MLPNFATEFSQYVFDKYYATDYLLNATEDDWKVDVIRETSVRFGFYPDSDQQELDDEKELALFSLIWNRFDHILYVNLERYHVRDQALFPDIYQDLLHFLEMKQIDCLVTVYSYDHFSEIPDMLRTIPFSYTGSNSENIYCMLEKMPVFLNDIPVLHISFDGVQFNDWNSKQFRFSVDIKEASLRVLSQNGDVIDTLFDVTESEKFRDKYLV